MDSSESDARHNLMNNSSWKIAAGTIAAFLYFLYLALLESIDFATPAVPW